MVSLEEVKTESVADDVIDELVATAVDNIRPVPIYPAWQPIETAPCRVEVLVSHGEGVCTATQESPDFWYMSAGGNRPMTLYDDQYQVCPTHWMPLPAPYLSGLDRPI